MSSNRLQYTVGGGKMAYYELTGLTLEFFLKKDRIPKINT